MTRTQRLLIVLLCILAGVLPILVYWTEHGGLGTPVFTEDRTISQAQQFAQAAAGLFIKPAYMMISLGLIIGLYGQTGGAMLSLFLGLIAFLTGETFCAVNFIVYKHTSIPSEYIHSYGMVLAFGFVTYAFLETLDRRLLRISNGRCAADELCATCKRGTPLACAARRTSQLTVVLMALISFLPLSATFSPESYTTRLFGFPYAYARFGFYQWYETRALPLLALACFAAALIPLLQPKGGPLPRSAKILFSAGVGALGFSLFRLTLASVFANDLVWFEFWEEATELMFISATGFILWQFRNTLLEKTLILEAVLGHID